MSPALERLQDRTHQPQESDCALPTLKTSRTDRAGCTRLSAAIRRAIGTSRDKERRALKRPCREKHGAAASAIEPTFAEPSARPACARIAAGHAKPGPVVRGLTWASVPWARTVNGQLEASVELIGVLSSGALTLTEPPRQPAAVNEEETLTLFPLPCETPAQGWQIRDLRRVGRQDEQAAVTYAEQQAEHAATWIDWDPSLSRAERARSPSQKGVLVFTFTENLEAHRHRLEQLWGGPLCVATGELTREAQSGIVARAADLLRREGRRHGMLCGAFSVSSDISNGSNRVSVSGLAWDAAKLSRWLSHGLAGFPVDINSPLVAEPAP